MSEPKLMTPVPVDPVKTAFSWPEAGLCGVGSCFADQMVQKLLHFGLSGDVNPNGIIYNAPAIAAALTHLSSPYTADDFTELNDRFVSWGHHGAFQAPTLDEAIKKTNQSRVDFLATLKSAALLIITPSSSRVYCLDGKPVANCHRYPNHHFDKRLLTVEENAEALRSAVSAARAINPDLHVIFSLSPVRHYPGEPIVDFRSKAALLEAIHLTVETTENASYFPAYEILMGELRDYRFYSDDLLHPSELARAIILDRFTQTYFSASDCQAMKAGEKAWKLAQHRPRS